MFCFIFTGTGNIIPDSLHLHVIFLIKGAQIIFQFELQFWVHPFFLLVPFNITHITMEIHFFPGFLWISIHIHCKPMYWAYFLDWLRSNKFNFRFNCFLIRNRHIYMILLLEERQHLVCFKWTPNTMAMAMAIAIAIAMTMGLRNKHKNANVHAQHGFVVLLPYMLTICMFNVLRVPLCMCVYNGLYVRILPLPTD